MFAFGLLVFGMFWWFGVWYMPWCFVCLGVLCFYLDVLLVFVFAGFCSCDGDVSEFVVLGLICFLFFRGCDVCGFVLLD